MKQTARPLFDNVLVRPLPKKKETKGGIIMPANKDASQIIEGTVVATGPGVPLPVAISGIGGLQTLANQPVVVKVNEHVVFKQYAGTSIKVNGEELFLLNQKDLLSAIDYEEK